MFATGIPGSGSFQFGGNGVLQTPVVFVGDSHRIGFVRYRGFQHKKRQMLRNMETNPGPEDPPKRVVLPVNLGERRLSDFCTTATHRLFEILSLDSSFLTNEPEEWQENESFQKAKDTVSAPRVTNDLAERGVALMTTFNSSLARDEEQKQYVLQVVEHHHQKYPKAKKLDDM
ncbi:hypothetical protein SNE40_018085 [Patella caerulea]|uniref:Uncharacterized protein n=1 Tax=Patella caerulea TaxID=87958 RepID=A0AAN8J9T3_PATCE